MPALVLDGDSLARIGAVEPRTVAPAPELGFDDVRVRVIDEADVEDAAAGLRLSDAVVLGRDDDPAASGRGASRIPQLERDLAAAARVSVRSRGLLVAAVGVAVAVLAVLALARGDGEQPQPSSPGNATAVSAPEAPRSASEDELRLTGNAWARRFAAAPRGQCVEPMSQPACERVICDSVRGPLENCMPLPLGVQRSFRGARVQDVVIEGRHAAARFTNGELVDFVDVGPPAGHWMVEEVGARAGRGVLVRRPSRDEKLELHGNAWARFFAASGSDPCVEHMTQPACEQVACERAGGGPVDDCVTPVAAFKRSFRDATVSDVVAVKGRRALARFSNGELVEFHYVLDGGGRWLVHKLGDAAGRGLL